MFPNTFKYKKYLYVWKTLREIFSHECKLPVTIILYLLSNPQRHPCRCGTTQTLEHHCSYYVSWNLLKANTELTDHICHSLSWQKIKINSMPKEKSFITSTSLGKHQVKYITDMCKIWCYMMFHHWHSCENQLDLNLEH